MIKEKNNLASERSCMQMIELIRLVRGVACAWEKIKIVVPSLDDFDSCRFFFGNDSDKWIERVYIDFANGLLQH